MGHVLAGRSAGGLIYGCRVTAIGERAIEPNEAEVVGRLVRAFAAGKSQERLRRRITDNYPVIMAGVSPACEFYWMNLFQRSRNIRDASTPFLARIHNRIPLTARI
jgi:hypothetical protein